MKKIAFVSSGCQGGLCKPRELIAARPDCIEVSNPLEADILMVNFCAISAENLSKFQSFRERILQCKRRNPRLQIIAGGCVEGLSEKKDLSFADAIFHHQEETAALAKFIAADDPPVYAPYINAGIANINIAQGCRRRCSFCKVHYLDYLHLTSRPLVEVLDLAQQAVAQGCRAVALVAENSSEYGLDIGTNLQTLLQELTNIEQLQYIDVYGLCLDEITPELLQRLRHPKVRTLQIEAQSLNDNIRHNMRLAKTATEALAILDALKHKPLISNLMVGFPGHSIEEFKQELELARQHHMYYLTYDPYDDTPGTPSHEIYRPLSQSQSWRYQMLFLTAIAEERKLILEQMMAQPSITAAVVDNHTSEICLCAANYAVSIHAVAADRKYQLGETVQVKITGLHPNLPDSVKHQLVRNLPGKLRGSMGQLFKVMAYFDIASEHQLMVVDGVIVP